jgi:hypothetical protein
MIQKNTLLGYLILLSCTLFAQINRPLQTKLLNIRNKVLSIDINKGENDILLDKSVINNGLAIKHTNHKISQSNNVLKQRLDSTVAALSYKELSLYNTKGQKIKYTSYNWSIFDNKWVGNTQEDYGYDQNGYNNFYSYSNRNSTTNSFVVGIKKSSRLIS